MIFLLRFVLQRLREGATEPLELNTIAKPEDEDDDDSDSSDDESETIKISKTIRVITLSKNQVAPNPETQLTSVGPSGETGSSAGKPLPGRNDKNESPTNSTFDIVTSRGEALPLPRIRKYATPPNWVASASHIQKKPPTVKFDTLGLHVLDHGPGANTLLTIRVLDGLEKVKESKLRTINRITQKREVKQRRRRATNSNSHVNLDSDNGNNSIQENGSRAGEEVPPKIERKSSIFNVLTSSGYGKSDDCMWTIEERSRAGVIGRVLDGVWLKILENVALDGVTDIAGELDDSPTTLACFLAMLLHSYSMTNLGALDYWINMVEADVQDIVVSKHTTHVKEMHRIVRG